MKLLFSSAVFVAILASASSIEEQAVVAKGQAVRKNAPIPSTFVLKQIAKSLVTSTVDKEDRESEDDDGGVSQRCCRYFYTPPLSLITFFVLYSINYRVLSGWEEQRRR